MLTRERMRRKRESAWHGKGVVCQTEGEGVGAVNRDRR